MNDIFFVVFVIVSILFIIGFLFLTVKKNNSTFDKNKKTGIAKIIGYDDESDSYETVFLVKLINTEFNGIYNLNGLYNVKKKNGDLDYNYPFFKIGDEVKVLYALKNTFGIKSVEVRLNCDCYDYPE